MLIFGNPLLTRLAGAMVILVVLFYMISKLSVDKSVIANLNSVKREFALVAGGGALMMIGGGTWFTLKDLWHCGCRDWSRQ